MGVVQRPPTIHRHLPLASIQYSMPIGSRRPSLTELALGLLYYHERISVTQSHLDESDSK